MAGSTETSTRPVSKIALLADTHAGWRNDNRVFNQYFLTFFEPFFAELKEHGIKTVIHLGDLFDRRRAVNFETLRSWRLQVFDRFQEEGIQWFVLLGNHDCYWKHTNEVNSVTELLVSYPNLTVISEPCIKKIHGVECMMLPWLAGSGVARAERLLETSAAQFVFGHLDIIGYEMNGGHRNVSEGFPPDKFGSRAVYSGHYHHSQRLPRHPNIFYLGTPYQLSWDQNGRRGAFYILDLQSNDLIAVENDNEILMLLHYNDTNGRPDALMEPRPSLKDKYVKLVVSEKQNSHWLEQAIAAIEQANPAELIVLEGRVELQAEDANFDATKDTLNILLDAAEEADTELDREKLKATFRELHQAALEIE